MQANQTVTVTQCPAGYAEGALRLQGVTKAPLQRRFPRSVKGRVS